MYLLGRVLATIVARQRELGRSLPQTGVPRGNQEQELKFKVGRLGDRFSVVFVRIWGQRAHDQGEVPH